jgi:hypothetical protein
MHLWQGEKGTCDVWARGECYFLRRWAIHLNDLRGMGSSRLVIRGGVIERLAASGESSKIKANLLWDHDSDSHLFVARGHPCDAH